MAMMMINRISLIWWPLRLLSDSVFLFLLLLLLLLCIGGAAEVLSGVIREEAGNRRSRRIDR